MATDDNVTFYLLLSCCWSALCFDARYVKKLRRQCEQFDFIAKTMHFKWHLKLHFH